MSFYYRLFFPNQAFREVDDIEKLVPFMYLNELEAKKDNENINQNIISKEPIIISETEKQTEKPNKNKEHKILEQTIEEQPISKNDFNKRELCIIQPKQPDSLFWCIYIALYGYNKYNEIGHRYGNIEIEEKQKIMEMMKKNPSKIKECPKRITKAQYQEIMSDFMTNKKITNEMLIMFALYYDIRIWIVNTASDQKNIGLPDSWYMDIYSNECLKKEPIIIYKKQGRSQQYFIEQSEGEQFIKITNNIKNKLFRFDNYDTPLKTISNYKIIDLEIFADQLDIEFNGKYKKQEVYDKIMQKIL